MLANAIRAVGSIGRWSPEGGIENKIFFADEEGKTGVGTMSSKRSADSVTPFSRYRGDHWGYETKGQKPTGPSGAASEIITVDPFQK